MNPPTGARTAACRGLSKQKRNRFFSFRIEDFPQLPAENFHCGKERLFPRGVRRGVLLLLASFLLAGCGYRLSGGEESVAPAFRTVFVDTFTNKTGEAYAESIFRSAFISRFVQEGRFQLARHRGEADLVFRGTVRSLQSSPLAYKANNLSAEDRLTVTLELSFEERESGRVIWTERYFVGTGDYRVTTAGVTESSRKNALVKLADDSAERAYRLMMSGF